MIHIRNPNPGDFTVKYCNPWFDDQGVLRGRVKFTANDMAGTWHVYRIELEYNQGSPADIWSAQLIRSGFPTQIVVKEPTMAPFSDPVLDSAIRGALGKPTQAITQTDLSGLTNLDCQSRDITSLAGLQYCDHLTTLNVADNQVSGISALASLTGLTTLNLSANEVADLSPLASLTSLATLNLSGNQAGDLSAMAYLTNLAVLHLEGNPISDITPLLENSGLGTGDEIWLEDTDLGLWEGSSDLADVNTLQGRGATVHHGPIGATINGQITLQGASRPPAARVCAVTVKLFPAGASNENLNSGTGAVSTFTVTTADPGNNNVIFQCVGASLPPGTYDITIVKPHTLRHVKKNVVIAGGANAVNFGTLLEGNCNDDNQVQALDFSILAGSYLKSTGQAGFNSSADFDGTGQVNSLDFSLMAGSYLKSSPVVAP